MDKRLDKIEEKIDKMAESVSTINTTLAAQHVSLQEHIRRTTLIEDQLMPIKTQADMIKGGVKLITVVGILVGIIEGVKALMHK